MARDGAGLRWLDRYAHCADWAEGEPIKRIVCADTGEEFIAETWAQAIKTAMKEGSP